MRTRVTGSRVMVSIRVGVGTGSGSGVGIRVRVQGSVHDGLHIVQFHRNTAYRGLRPLLSVLCARFCLAGTCIAATRSRVSPPASTVCLTSSTRLASAASFCSTCSAPNSLSKCKDYIQLHATVPSHVAAQAEPSTACTVAPTRSRKVSSVEQPHAEQLVLHSESAA